MIRADSQLFRLQNYQEMSLLVCVFGNNVIMTIEVERDVRIVGMAFPVLDSMKQRSEGLRTSIHWRQCVDNCILIKPETAWEVILEQNNSIMHGFLVAAISQICSSC